MKEIGMGLRILLFLVLASACKAITYSKTYTVTPGNNGSQTISRTVKQGDVLNVTFRAATGYRLVTATVNDSERLGWTPNGQFSFRLTAPANLAANTYHKAQFSGTLVRIPRETANGTPNRLTPPQPLAWNLEGKFSVLFNHEGVGSDAGRNPQAELESQRPGGQRNHGVATWNETTRQFDGTFLEGSQHFTGQYLGTPYAAAATGNPEFLNKETKNCPDGDGTQVVYAYFGCRDNGGIGGRALPDRIELNSFTVEPALGNARTQLGQLQAVTATARQALAQAQAALQAIQANIDRRQRQLDARIAREVAGLVTDAQGTVDSRQRVLDRARATRNRDHAQLTAAQQALNQLINNHDQARKIRRLLNQINAKRAQISTAQNGIAEARQVLADRNATRQQKAAARRRITQLGRQIRNLERQIRDVEKQIKRIRNSAKIRNAIRAVDRRRRALATAQAAMDQAQKRLTQAQNALKKAQQNAEARVNRERWVVQARQRLAALETQKTAAEAAVANAQTAVTDALAAEASVRLTIANLTARLELWNQLLVSLQAHEDEHRTICYFYVNRITAMLERLRAWGYAPAEARARALGQIHYRKVWRDQVVAIQASSRAMQSRFDNLTNHGADPDRWNRARELR